MQKHKGCDIDNNLTSDEDVEEAKGRCGAKNPQSYVRWQSVNDIAREDGDTVHAGLEVERPHQQRTKQSRRALDASEAESPSKWIEKANLLDGSGTRTAIAAVAVAKTVWIIETRGVATRSGKDASAEG